MNMPEDVSATPGYSALMARLQPLIDGGRLDNIVDLLSLVSDLIDLLDAATVEKLANVFEEVTASGWAAANTLRMTKAEIMTQGKPPSLYALLKLLNEEDTRKGVAVVLKTLNVIGRQL
ncbi:DUF1641 domain-containing protein [Pseudomonas sp. B2M1-30]|uniref:DUF1641 domain-containing protein n=1 Tax=Pseudomonas TaxID=286 RepID=UPI0021C7B437|nr:MULTISPECIES: DUF1641 domain-containing protein [Pseudomonas]MCU0120375.1 DUF1641 domain-containing protein [Pseudomonas sp. B2M1-30]MCU7262393.1 DUF1641 domain-containing protein [Pseudomonas koreensis]